jgi:hypothetical protein
VSRRTLDDIIRVIRYRLVFVRMWLLSKFQLLQLFVPNVYYANTPISLLIWRKKREFCVDLIPTATANGYSKCNYSAMNTRSSNFRPLEFVLGDCHGQSLLAVEYCLGVQNNTRVVKVLKDDYTLMHWFSVLRELLTELNCSCWSICVASIDRE